MALAIFDLDGTILSCDSDKLWGDFLAKKEIIDATDFEKQFSILAQKYDDGSLDILEGYKYLLSLISSIKIKDLVELREEFQETHIRPNLQQAALDRIQWHRNWGDKIVVVSATNRFLSQASTNLINPDALLASEPHAENGYFTGKIVGYPTFGEGKPKAIREWATRKKETLAGSWGYGDSVNDIPMLNICKYRVAVDHSGTHAQQ